MRPRIPLPPRDRLIAATLLLLGACIGPQGSHRPGYDGPTGPTRQAETHLRGTVIDQGTGAAIAGAVVETDEKRTTSAADGTYQIGGLTMLATTVITSHVGYDTARTLLPLEGGDKLWIVRLRPTVPPALSRP